MAGTSPVIRQIGFRGRSDSMGLNSDTWDKEAQNVDWSQNAGEVFRLRLLISDTVASTKSNNRTFGLQFSINGGGFTAVGTTTAVQGSLSAHFVDDALIVVSQLAGGQNNFVTGRGDTDGVAPNSGNISLGGGNDHTEIESCLIIDSAQVNDADEIVIRATGVDATPTSEPTITVVKGEAPPPNEGSAVAAHTWSTSAAGEAPPVSPNEGSAVAGHAWTTTAAGEATHEGEATVTHSWATSATGAAPSVGASEGSAVATHSWTTTADGETVHEGAASAGHSWTTSADGEATHEGTAVAGHSWGVTASGEAPAADGITPVQSAGHFGESAVTSFVAEFGATPTEGNLLVAVTGQRTGDIEPSSISGTGWSAAVHSKYDVTNSNARRMQTMWWKVAGSSEPTEITASYPSSVSGGLVIAEFGGFTGTPTYQDTDAGPAGADAATSWPSGELTPDSVPAAAVSALIARHSVVASEVSFDSGFIAVIAQSAHPNASSLSTLALSFFEPTSATETSTTASWTTPAIAGHALHMWIDDDGDSASGSAVASHTWTVTAAGATLHEGAAVAEHSWTTTASGEAPAVPGSGGSATVGHRWGVTATGRHAPEGSATAGHTWGVAATGEAPAVPGSGGSAVATHSWTTSAAGERPSQGSAVAAHAWTTTAEGQAPAVPGSGGTAVVTHTWTVTAEGEVVREGSAVAGHSWTTAADGERPSQAVATVGHSWTTTASGEAPALEVSSGSAVAGHSWGVSASGARVSAGIAVATHLWKIAATSLDSRPRSSKRTFIVPGRPRVSIVSKQSRTSVVSPKRGLP